MCRTFHLKTSEYTFFSSAHGTFSNIDHMLAYKTSLNKLNKIEITSGIFSDLKDMKLEINYKKKTGKNKNTWRLNNMLLRKQYVNEDINEKIKRIP